MSKYFNQDWFGKVGLFMREFGNEYVGVHVHNPRDRCKIYKIHEDDFETPEVWRILKSKVDAEEYIPLGGGLCPNCRMPLLNWKRYYRKKGNTVQKRWFCSYCGERLDER
ncbi:MAG: hypothetical protein KKD77_23910 [Gammaproteobacteria bacterium]|nr:hypothetical protein [Gammaproteobacteria bacterium]